MRKSTLLPGVRDIRCGGHFSDRVTPPSSIGVKVALYFIIINAGIALNSLSVKRLSLFYMNY